MSAMDAMDVEDLLKLLVELVNSAYQKEGINNVFLTIILSRLRELNYHENFCHAALEHSKTINKVHSRFPSEELPPIEPTFVSAVECISYYAAKFFFSKMNKYCYLSLPFNVNYDIPSKGIPLEAFLKPDKESITAFENKLQLFDVLYVEVTNPNFKYNNLDFVEVRIIRKDDNIIVYHLDIKAYLMKKEATSCLGRQFEPCELLRVVMLLTKGKQDEKKVHFVAINNNIQHSSAPVLGVISENELSFDWKSFKTASKFQSFAHYLKNHHNFNNCNLNDDMLSIGIDPYHTYSFNEEEDELLNPPGFLGDALKKREAQKHLEEATMFVETGDILSALPAFDEAIKLWPQNCRIYEMRGKMYAAMNHDKHFDNLRKACYDFKTALILNSASKVAREELANILTYAANRYQKRKNYDVAKMGAETALKLNKHSEQAADLLKKINGKIQRKKKHSEIDSNDLIVLEKKRKKIKTLLNMSI